RPPPPPPPIFFFNQKTAYEICACLVGSEMCIRYSKLESLPNFNQRVSLGRNDLLIRTFLNICHYCRLFLF
ncbi:hypothetical protein B1M15_20210, partial [Salmonella enterica subsp. enterica serovar Dublin]